MKKLYDTKINTNGTEFKIKDKQSQNQKPPTQTFKLKCLGQKYFLTQMSFTVPSSNVKISVQSHGLFKTPFQQTGTL